MAYSRFGLITPTTDVEELVALVYATGKEIEESSRVSTRHYLDIVYKVPLNM